MTGGEALVRTLHREGVRVVFGLPGVQLYGVMAALREEPRIRFIATRHDQATSYMADGYARVSGRFGVCVTGAGSGATIAAAGAFVARTDGSPLLLLVGEGADAEVRGGPLRDALLAEEDALSALRAVSDCCARIDHADHVGSTKSILDFALSSPADTILVATEPHIIHQMEKAAPDKTFIGVPGGDGNCNCNMCPYMALNTLEKLYVALRDLEPRIDLSTEIMDRARVPLERMLEMAGRTVGQGDVGKPIIDPRISGD